MLYVTACVEYLVNTGSLPVERFAAWSKSSTAISECVRHGHKAVLPQVQQPLLLLCTAACCV